MTAREPRRRNRTARDLAEQFDVHPRTVRDHIAEPRAEFLARAKERRAKVVALRLEGRMCKEIAEEIGATTGAVRGLLSSAVQRGELPDLSGVPGFDGRCRLRTVLTGEEQQRVVEWKRFCEAGRARRVVVAERRVLTKDLYQAGLSMTAIAEALGVSLSSVSRNLSGKA